MKVNDWRRGLMFMTAAIVIVGGLVCLGLGPCRGADMKPYKPAPQVWPHPQAGQPSPEPLYPEWWGRAPDIPDTIPCKEPGTCIVCHEKNGEMDPPHAVSCSTCHGGNDRSKEQDAAHIGLVADPGDLRHARKTCGTCHPDEVRRVSVSPMALAPRMINHTRFAFGAQKTAHPLFGTAPTDGIKQIPDPSMSENAVDDLLRRACLRCHLHTKGSARWGEHRGSGCSACHVARPNSPDGKPKPHAVVRRVGLTACLKCHNSNHVGADYIGLFEKDFERGFRSPFVKGKLPPTIYGAEQHRLLPDVHFTAGMDCMDCHTLDEVHGTGEPPTSPRNNVKISCRGCHVDGDHPTIRKGADGSFLMGPAPSRVVPKRDGSITPHRIPAHNAKVRCSACHAAWSFQDYGFHLMLEKRADYWKWAPLSGQNDPQVQEILRKNVGTYADLVPPQGGPIPAKAYEDWEPPRTRDWLNGELRPGAWFRGFTIRRWADPPLGRDSGRRVTIMRPIYQYVISYVDEDASLILDRIIPSTGSGDPALIVNPYAPHTIARAGRSCHECHGNPKAVGLGFGVIGNTDGKFHPVMKAENEIPGHSFRWDAVVTKDGKPLQHSTHPDAGPLKPETVKKLLNPSKQHRIEWYHYLRGQ